MNSLKLSQLGTLLLLTAAVGLAFYGQPNLQQKWEFLAPEYKPRLLERGVHVDPGELLDLMQNDYIKLLLIDVRSESDWNLFHLKDAERIPQEKLPDHRKRFAALPGNGVIVLVSNDETLATSAWKDLMALAQPNAYILQGGLNYWLDVYGYPEGQPPETATQKHAGTDETLRHHFRLALGSRHPAAAPDPDHVQKRKFQPKVKLLKKIQKKGGCG